jgi:hypothetical protein
MLHQVKEVIMSRTWTILSTAALSAASLAFAQDAATSRVTGVPANDPDMQRAIQFQRAKDRADLRQAQKERRHPSVSYDSADRQAAEPNAVKDPGERQWKKHKSTR